MISHMAKIFADVSEKEITRTIAEMFNETMREYTDSDVIIIGAGPAGLTAGRDLAKAGVKTLIIEQNNYLGGGYWVGGYMMNPVTVRAPAQKVWDELGVPYRKINEGLYATWGPHACSKLIGAACDAGVRFLQLTKFDDAVLNYTDEVFPGLIATGMSVTETHGLPRMGPTFGSMLLSGKKAAEVALGKLKEMPSPPKLRAK